MRLPCCLALLLVLGGCATAATQTDSAPPKLDGTGPGIDAPLVTVDAGFADAIVSDVDAPAACCVHLQGVTDGTTWLCACPGYSGIPAAANPNVVYYPGGISSPKVILCGGADQSSSSRNFLGISAVANSGLPPATYGGPFVDYYNGSGAHYQEAGAGQIVVDNWPSVGEQVTGSLTLLLNLKSGTGPNNLTLTGTFCSLRQQ